MLTVLIETQNDEEGLARTLASLVGGAVEGVIRDVIVFDRGSTDQTRKVAEHAGCRYLEGGGLMAGVRLAKGEWLLILEPGSRLVDGWIEPVVSHGAHSMSPARFSRSRDERPSIISRIFSARTALSTGLLIRKGRAADIPMAAQGAEALARGLSLRRLTAEIRVAPKRRKPDVRG